jgi:hypothetical protein
LYTTPKEELIHLLHHKLIWLSNLILEDLGGFNKNNIVSRNAEIFQNYLSERTNSCREEKKSFQGILIFGNGIYNWA